MTLSVLPEGGMSSPSGRSLRGSHQMASFTICSRLAYLRYIERWILKRDKETRLRGTLIHLAMAYYYASLLLGEKPKWFYETDLQTALEEKGSGLPDGIQKAKEVLYAYRQEHEKETWQPWYIEDEFFATVKELDPGIDAEIATLEQQVAAAPVDSKEQHQARYKLQRLRYLKTFDDEVVSCRPDLICQDEYSNLWIVDHKSRGKPWGKKKGLESWKEDGEYLLDWQVLVNLHVVRAPSNASRLRGVPLKGFIIQRFTREPDKDGDYFTDRNVLTVPRKAYDAAPRRIREAVAVEHETREQVENGMKTAQNFWACQGRYGECDYRRICAAKDDEKAYGILQSDYKQEVVKQEDEE